MHILFVCTGNIFRSPMAQGYLAALARRRGLEPVVTSAGTLGGDRPISPNALEVMGADGIAMADHRSRALVAEEIQAVDLVLGMAREHVREAVLLVPAAWEKSFTLKELVRRGEAIGRRNPDQPLEQWLDRAGAGRQRMDLLGDSVVDDVLDPLNAPMSVLRATAEEIRGLVGRLLDLLEPA